MTAAADRFLTEDAVPFVDLPPQQDNGRTGAAFDAARQQSWLVRTTRGYEVIEYAACRELSVDRRLDGVGPDYYRRLGASEQVMWYATQASLPMIEEPRHARIRKALQHGFTRPRVERMRPLMRQAAWRLVEQMAGRDPFDVVGDFTDRYPIEVLCALMGVPDEDIDRFGSWTVDLGLLAKFPLEPHLPRIDAAIRGLRGYFAELIGRSEDHPGEDFVAAVVAAQGETGSLTHDELCGALLNLLFAGHDTTRYQFGTMVHLLVRHGWWQRIRADADAIPGAVEEALRLEPSLHILLRQAREDFEYRGLVLPAGTLLILNTFAANRDPAMFPEPNAFDPARTSPGKHLTFGSGGRMCLGHLLARTEMAEALQVFLEWFPLLALAGEPQMPAGLSAMNGVETLPLTRSVPR
ncbi:cytochrome P450 [Amycolatopsis silviterrae]|uniref:Cytochrome P450 n=1 Tax=Amycolatopsis silviterrae TaxID=1656914 RepID=A0ABW5H7I1_9PSEU